MLLLNLLNSWLDAAHRETDSTTSASAGGVAVELNVVGVPVELNVVGVVVVEPVRGAEYDFYHPRIALALLPGVPVS